MAYQSYFDIKQPTYNPVATATPKPSPKSQPQPKAKGLLGKIGSIASSTGRVAKGFGEAAITGEKQFATGIARVLPGGTADIQAQQKQAESAAKNVQFTKQQQKAGKVTPAAASRIIQSNAESANQAAGEQAKTIKAMPSKKQIALGAASTAADILTAGTLSKGKAGLTAPEKLVPVIKGTTKAGKIANIGGRVAANSTAGGLNAAAGGGSKSDVAKNALLGAVLPEALHVAGTTVARAGEKVHEKVPTKAKAQELATNVRTQNALSKLTREGSVKPTNELEVMAAKQADKQAKTGVADLPAVPEEPKPVIKTEPLPTTRPPEQIKTDIQANADHVKTITGKNPNSFIEADKIKPETPKDAIPYLEKHQTLQKEYVDATSPKLIQDIQKKLPEGYKVNDTGSVVDSTGKELSTGEVQQLTQPKLLSDFEKATQAGDEATMQKIAAAHPNDARVNITTKPSPELEAIRKTPTKDTGAELQSRVYNRLKAEHPELKDDVSYDAIRLKEDAQKAADLVAKDKNKAYRVAMGAEELPDQTSTAVNIALSEKALQEGNHSLYSQLIKNRSLAQTRRGQELVAEKGSVTDNSTSRYVKELLNARLEKLGKGYLNDIKTDLRGATRKERATAVIDKEVSKAQKKIASKQLDLQEAQSLIDSLKC